MAKKETLTTRLVRMETKQDFLCTQITNHLKHHWAVTLVLLSTTLTLAASVVIMLLKK